MSILIKDMEMPKSCDNCEFIQRGYPDWCDLSCRSRDVFDSSIRPDWCPLEYAEPIKHGRWTQVWHGKLFPWDTTCCSVCGAEAFYDEVNGYYKSNYCGNCGAKMSSEVENDL